MVKVSIISPCYNGEKHLIPYINGLLSQTYSNVEFIFVNDGSTDKTEEIINSYSQKFKEKGWTFNYIRQEKRGGQAKAINQGLKIFSGDYLCCIDSDDVILSTFLDDMVSFMDNNLEYAIAFSWSQVVDEKTNKIINYYKRNVKPHVQDTLFDDFILQKNHNENYIQYTAAIIRSKCLFKIYPNRQIYEGKSGQNAQLILPILYNYKCGYVKKILYKAIARENSDSRLTSTQDFIDKTYSWENIYCNVIRIIPNMPDYEKGYYFKYVKDYWQLQRDKAISPTDTKEIVIQDKFLEKIFSVKNNYSNNKKHKVLTILGIKIKFKVTETLARVERERERE